MSSLMVALEFVRAYLDDLLCITKANLENHPLTTENGECGHTKVNRANKTKKRAWYWDTVHQKAFDDVKTTIAKDVVLASPDYSREFEIYTDASSKQLGSVITQGNRPLAIFSRKLSTEQQKYSMTELELLAIVETLTS
eukprot:CCRYP_002919-RA/>CCRYP_002919-RA protein AED:0.36 eAED:0.36 QI:0/0/0/1/1/1/2/0/138